MVETLLDPERSLVLELCLVHIHDIVEHLFHFLHFQVKNEVIHSSDRLEVYSDASLAMCLCQFLVVFNQETLVQSLRAAKDNPERLTETFVIWVSLTLCQLNGFYDQGFCQWVALYTMYIRRTNTERLITVLHTKLHYIHPTLMFIN